MAKEHTKSKEQLKQQIIEYAKEGSCKCIKQTIAENPDLDINACDEDGGTALHWAVAGNKIDTVEFLLSLGADINARCEIGTALDVAQETQHVEMVELLKVHIKNGTDQRQVTHKAAAEDIRIPLEKVAISEEDSLETKTRHGKPKSAHQASFAQIMAAAERDSQALVKQRESNRQQDRESRGGQTGSIVWVKPSSVHDASVDQEREQVVFTGKTPDKTVYLPFSQVHRYLYEAGRDLRGTNYLFGHLFFIVSDRPYKKEPKTGKYQGGRTYVDFPLLLSRTDVASLEVQKSPKPGAEAESLRTYPISSSTDGTFVGGIGKLGSHSEHGLKAALTTDTVVDRIVNDLRNRLPIGHKVYEVVMFLNSTLNICNDIYSHGRNTGNCETVLSNLQSSYGDGTFLKQLQIKLEERNYLVVSPSSLEAPERHQEKTETRPRCLFMVSANEEYINGKINRTPRLKQQAHAAFTEGVQAATIDIRRLAGQVVPSVPIDVVKAKQGAAAAAEHNSPKITGFHSCNYRGFDDAPDQELLRRAQIHKGLTPHRFFGEDGEDTNWQRLIKAREMGPAHLQT